MDHSILKPAKQAASILAQIQSISLLESGAIPEEYKDDIARQILETGPLADIDIAIRVLGRDNMSPALAVGLLVQTAVKGLINQEMAEENDEEDIEPTPEEVEDLAWKLKQLIGQIRSASPEADHLISEIENLHLADEYPVDPENDDFYLADEIGGCSETFRQMHMICEMRELAKLYFSAIGAQDNEYTDMPVHKDGFVMGFDTFQAAQPLPPGLNAAFVKIYNAAAEQYHFENRITEDGAGGYLLVLKLADTPMPQTADGHRKDTQKYSGTNLSSFRNGRKF